MFFFKLSRTKTAQGGRGKENQGIGGNGEEVPRVKATARNLHAATRRKDEGGRPISQRKTGIILYLPFFSCFQQFVYATYLHLQIV